MGYYFSDEESIFSKYNSDIKKVTNKIIERYRTDNPETPVQYFMYPKNNYRITEDYLDEIKLHEKFPNMENESYAYAWSMLNSVDGGDTQFRINVFGPVFLYVNGELAYRSNLYGERFNTHTDGFRVKLKKGENSLVFLCIKTPLGCGFRIGSGSYKGRRIQFFAPTKERESMGGFIYSEPISKPLDKIPSLYSSEKETGLKWFPEIDYSEEEKALCPTERIFNDADKKYLAYTRIRRSEKYGFSAQINGFGESVIYIKPELEKEFTTLKDNSSKNELVSSFGCQPTDESTYADVVVFGKKPEIIGEFTTCPIMLKSEIDRNDDKLKCLYAGPFVDVNEEDLLKYIEVMYPMKTENGEDFWHIDKKDCRIRPYNEGMLFGEWSYPLGVTLYGFLKAGQLYEDKALIEYVGNHLKKAVGFYEYCVWDKKTYGAAPFLHQLTTLDCLDDCGSFASGMLEYMKSYELIDGELVAKVVGDFISNEQYRLEDGTFYRDKSYFSMMDGTLWADDMYMSIPFMCRYYQKTKDEKVLEDIINQAKNFFKYLYMPEVGIMSHIYDVKYELQTKVPWGRGNGWTIFSITELLLILPKEHRDYNEIVKIYRTLCEGFIKYQDENGMWHQVITMETSYPETSCTAMFVYSFAYGVINGWLEQSEKFRISALKGFEAICKTSVDFDGNLLGVCRGSGYSFSKEYYANDLSWNKNDTHGTGIVILAGVAVELMKNLD